MLGHRDADPRRHRGARTIGSPHPNPTDRRDDRHEVAVTGARPISLPFVTPESDPSCERGTAGEGVSRPSRRGERHAADVDHDVDGPEPPTGQQILDTLGARLALGAVFHVPDRLAVPRSGSLKTHPYVIIGGLPLPTDTPDQAVARSVVTSWRESWKPEFHGQLPTSAAEEAQLLRTRQSVFSPRGTLARCDRDGVFSVSKKRSIAIRHLVASPFLGWLPKPAIDWLIARASGIRVPDPYPPTDRSGR